MFSRIKMLLTVTAMISCLSTIAFAADDAADEAAAPTEATTSSVDASSVPEMQIQIGDKVVNDEIKTPMSTFKKDTPEIFVIVTTDQVKKGQKVKAIWIADDTNGVAPADYKIDEKSLDVSDEMTPEKDWVATFSLTKPNDGWPVGQYHVGIYVDDVLSKNIKFEVK